MQNGCQQSLSIAKAQLVFNVQWMPTKSLCSNSSTSVQCRMDANKVSLQQQLNQCSMQNGANKVSLQQQLNQCSVQNGANKVSLQQQLNQCSVQNGCQQSLFVATAQPVFNVEWCQQSLFVATAQPVFNVEWMPTKFLCSNSSTSVQYRMVPTKSLCSNSSTSVQCRKDANKVSLQQQLNQCSMQNGANKVSLQQQLNQCSMQNGANKVSLQQQLNQCSVQNGCHKVSLQQQLNQCLMQNGANKVSLQQQLNQCSIQNGANKVSLQQQLNQCSIQNGCQQSLFVAIAQPVFIVEWMPTKSLCSNSSISVQYRMDANKVSLQQQLNQCSMQNGANKVSLQQQLNQFSMWNGANKVSLQQQLNQCSMQNGCQQSLFVATAQPVFNVEWMPTKSLYSNSLTSVQYRMDANKVSLQQQLNQCSMQNGCQQSLFIATAQPVVNVEWMLTKSLCSNSSTSVLCRMVPTKSLCSNSSTSVQCRMDANKVSLQQQLNQCSMQNGCLQSLFVATVQPVFNVEWMPTKSLCSNSSTSVQCRMDANKLSLQQQLNQCSMQNGCQQSVFVATAQSVFNAEWMPTNSLCSNSSTSVQCRMDANKVSLQQQLNQCSMQNGCQQSLFVATSQPVFNVEWCQQSLFLATAQPVFNVEWMPTKSLCSNSSTSVQCRMNAIKGSLRKQLNQCSMQNECQQRLFVATAQPVFNVEWMPTKSLCSNSSTSVQCRMDANKVSLQQQLNQCSMQNGCLQSLFVATAQPVFNVEWMPTKSLSSNSSTSVQCRMDANKALFVATAQPVFNVEWMPTNATALCSQQSLFLATAQPVFNVEWNSYKVFQNGCQQSLFVATAQPVFNVE